MNIKVLGSGCIYTKYNSASYLIDDNVLFDVPNGTCKTLLNNGVDPNTIKFVILTHFHGDHYFDMPFLLLSKIKKGKTGLVVYCDKDGKNKITSSTKLSFPSIIKRLREDDSLIYNHKETFSLKKYNVERLLVSHGHMKPSYGYVFSFNNKKVGFTGDSSLCDNIKLMASTCDYLICDCTFIVGDNRHIGVDNLVDLAIKYKDCKFYATHSDDEVRNELIHKKIDNIIILHDGMDLVLK